MLLTRAAAALLVAALTVAPTAGLQLAQRVSSSCSGARRSGRISAMFDSPLWQQQQQSQPLSLPPAADRNVVAEILAAAEFATRQAGLSADDRPSSTTEAGAGRKPIRIVAAIVAGQYQQLVAEEISQLTEGKHAGKSWLRPLAMRSCENVTLATDAFRYDPQLGWFTPEAEKEAGSGLDASVHVFSPLVPAVFLPSSLVHEAEPGLALAVRMMCDAHAAQVHTPTRPHQRPARPPFLSPCAIACGRLQMNLEDDADDQAAGGFFDAPNADRQQLRPFLFAVSSQE